MQSEGVLFRPIEEADLDILVEIERASHPEPWSRGLFADELNPQSASGFYIMMLENEIAGYGGIWCVLDEAHITNVTVRPDLRGRGLGRVLLEYLLQKASARGAESVLLEVREGNEPAIGLYRRAGFETIGRRKNYYQSINADAFVMRLDMTGKGGTESE